MNEAMGNPPISREGGPLETLFDQNLAQRYDEWFSSPVGQYVKQMEEGLILELLRPEPGESLLDVGCGTGNHLILFRDLGLEVAGVDPSVHMLDVARKKLGARAELRLGRAEDLPFDDGSFDIVTMISSLEFSQPRKALAEAFRVARSRVFIGVLNSFSTNGIQRKAEALIKPTIYRHARFYSVWELKSLVKRISSIYPLDWGSVILLPLRLYFLDQLLSRWVPKRRNPFGAFLGMRVDLLYTHRTVLNPLFTTWKDRAKARPSYCTLGRTMP